MSYQSKNKYGPVQLSQRASSISTWDSSTCGGDSPWASDAALSKSQPPHPPRRRSTEPTPGQQPTDTPAAGSGVVPKPRENRKGNVVIVSQYHNEVYGPGEPSRREMVQNSDGSSRRRA